MKKRMKHWQTMLIFPLVLVYLELVFRGVTGNPWNGRSVLYTLLFSLSYGGVAYLLTSLFPKKQANRWIGSILCGLLCLVYTVEFLTYKQFKQFYDIQTVAGGAGGVLTGFVDEIISLLFQQGGIWGVLLLFVPLAAYPVLTHKWLPARGGNTVKRVLALVLAALLFLLARGMVLAQPGDAANYDTEYNFQSAVKNFGLMTGLRLDIQSELFEEEVSFEVPATMPTEPVTQPTTNSDQTEPEETVSETTSETIPETTEPPVIQYNEIDIDFAALDEIASTTQQNLNAYVSSLQPSCKNQYTGLFEGKNLIFITAEAFTAELIREDLNPTLYRMATKGIQFLDYYQPSGSGTTGGEYQNVFGMIPSNGGISFKNTEDNLNYYTIGSQLDRLGYYGKAYHNNDYTYYNRHITHNNIGYSDGFMGYGNGMEEFVVPTWPESDLEMFMGTVPTYIDKQPFNIYYMTVSGHSNYWPAANAMTEKHWDRVKDLPYSTQVKGYYACNLELEDSMAYLLEQLEAKGILDDTVIVISADHFPYGLDSGAGPGNMPVLSELYGYKVQNYLQQDHSRLIIWSGCLEDMDPIVVDTPTFSLDVLPTLSNLFGTEFDSRLLPGRDVFSDAQPLVFNTNYDWKTELGTYYASSGKFEPVSEDTVIPEGYVDYMKTVVRNKMKYCEGALNTDYFRLIFGQEEE